MRLVYRPGHPCADENDMVDAEMAGPKHIGGQAVSVITDEMPATRHMANGRYYTSKAKFREATRAAGCIEIGNETETVLKPKRPAPLSREQRVRDIKNSIEQLRSGMRR